MREKSVQIPALPASDQTEAFGSTRLSRRGFFRTAGTVGALGTLGGLTLKPLGPEVLAQQSGYDFARPATLRPGGQLDSRFPVSFAEPVTQGLRLVMEFFTALNRRDVTAIADTLHFPFAIYEEIEPLVYQTRADFINNPPPTLNASGRGFTRIGVDSYDLLEGINVHLYCPVGGVYSLDYARYNAQGYKLFDCQGVYSVTNNDGRWAIQLISTIWHEAGYEDNEYPDAETSHRVGGQGYLSAFGYNDEELLNNLSVGRGSYEPELPVGTRRASVSFGYGPRGRSQDARDNDPMQGWRVTGVTSRLNVSEVTESTGTGTTDTRLAEFSDLAGGAVGEYSYTRLRPDRPLVLHATHDKAHVLNGYWRYTADGTLISETRGVGIRIWRAGNWGDVGGLGQVTHHDRSNSPDL
ncbi:MAG: hypothetical protein R3F41_18000 [Gammaproteobacteria bacterium]|nr:hypothetical protein [Pseudomonadales bacterium]MCP5347442.1 hypothetical protein [Pseudomonadales bacterium]